MMARGRKPRLNTGGIVPTIDPNGIFSENVVGKVGEPADIQDSVVDDGAKVLGQPASLFTSSEQSYIDAEMERYKQILSKSPASQRFVYEMIMADINLQRHDRVAAETMRGIKDPDERIEMSVKLEKQRTLCMKRFIGACEACGQLPKDAMLDDEKGADCMAIMHTRYMTELNKRRQEGWLVGEVGPEADILAKEHGLDPNKYRAKGVVADDLRREVIRDNQSVVGGKDGA